MWAIHTSHSPRGNHAEFDRAARGFHVVRSDVEPQFVTSERGHSRSLIGGSSQSMQESSATAEHVRIGSGRRRPLLAEPLVRELEREHVVLRSSAASSSSYL